MKLIEFLLGIIIAPIMWLLRVVWKLNRLEKIEMVPLRASTSQAIELYGEPGESKPDEKCSGATTYTFSAGPFHEVVMTEWKDKIHEITYWSEYPDPTIDIKCMFETYGEGKKWKVITEGYLYLREDDDRALWCSAIPAIGVGTTEFRDAKKAAKVKDIEE